MANDPYQTLGVPKGASEEDIRRSFRALAKSCHPDLHPGDKSAAERFRTLSAAYDIIGDPEKRKLYDAGEIDAAGDPRRGFAGQHANGAYGRAGRSGFRGRADDFSYGDIFADIFGSQRGARGGGDRQGFRTRGQDVRYTLDVDFLESVAGARKRVTLPEGGVLDLAVPEGVTDGQVLRLRGKGGAGPEGGEHGDALVEIKVRPHPDLKRQGDDILSELPVTLDEAVLGAKIEVTTISGRVQLAIPKGTSSGTVLRLKGKGVKNLSGGTTGDHLVSVRIVLPDHIDDALAYFISEWRQKYKYDPGRRG